MSTTLEDYPEQVAEAIRDMLDIGLDREVPAITVIDFMLRQFAGEPEVAERILRYVWDRYVEQPRRDALKPQTAGPPEEA